MVIRPVLLSRRVYAARAAMEGDPGIMVNIRFLRVSIVLTAEAVRNYQSQRA